MREILTKLRESKLFHALAIWGNMPVENVYRMTSHRFAHLLSKIPFEPEMLKLASLELPLLPRSLNRDFHSSRFAWCPHCLKEAQYVRLHWHLPFMTCCEKHQCWLLEDCPNCRYHLHEADIHAATCPNCHYPLPTALAPNIPVGDLLLRMQDVLLAWAYTGQTNDLPGLEKIPPATLLRVLHGLRYSAQRAGQTWQFHYQASTIPVPELEIFKQRLLSPFDICNGF
jgi:hypothetical protein